MILKIKDNDGWEFLDKIDKLTIVMEDEQSKEALLCYVRNREANSREVSTECYVLNDDGKTIEKII